ncbi:MAG: hypothetical protein KatS3mg060_3154 [Dehalococcoidia bacterium]|nr:MAG: hypothetical protein KatS3mg060_3154 [Dehalococcoidia bacterium]
MEIHFDHVALAAPQRDPVRDFVLDFVGGRVIVQQRSPQTEQGFRGVQIDIGGAVLEIIEPTSPASFLHPYLAKRGPGLHHLTWYVADLDRFLERLTVRGIPLTGVERDADGAATNAFIRPSASFGVLLQFRPLADEQRERKRNAPDWQDLPPAAATPRPACSEHHRRRRWWGGARLLSRDARRRSWPAGGARLGDSPTAPGRRDDPRDRLAGR